MEEPDVSMRQEAVMEHTTLDRLERVPMSREEFDALPEGVRAEYVDGVAVMAPPSTGDHNGVGVELAVALRAAFPAAFVRYERGLELPSGRLRIADVAVSTVRDDLVWSTTMPVIVIEILSPTTQREDLFRKTDDYRRAGIQQYWIVDRSRRELTVLGNAGDAWETLLELDEKTPRGEVTVADLGTVALDLDQLLS